MLEALSNQSRPSQKRNNSYGVLEKIRTAFKSGEHLVSIATQMKLTKTEKALCDVLLLNDTDLVKDVDFWIQSRSSVSKIMSRYREFDPRLLKTSTPDHFAARIVSGLGSVSSGQNIFLFFPECLGLQGRGPEDFFGIELIDVWANVFQRAVFPCTRMLLNSRSQIQALSQLGRNLDKTIYLASIFHEVGHQVGSWRVSPQKDSRLKVSQFYLDVFGEMSTDSLLVKNLSEFPEIAIFVLLQRLFWFGRRGFRDNPQSARINTDNDSWLSALVWNRMLKSDALTREGQKWHLNLDRAVDCFSSMATDIELLGQRVLALSTQEEQDRLAFQWMTQEVEWCEEQEFLLPRSLIEAYGQCVHIEEIPYFHPLAETTFKGVEYA